MPGSATTPGRTCARVGAQVRVAFRRGYGVGTRIHPSIAAQWLAYAFPCRRFDHTLADMTARLGASVVRYAFTAEDLHLILLAGLPAHSLEGWPSSQPVDAVVESPEGLSPSGAPRTVREPRFTRLPMFGRCHDIVASGQRVSVSLGAAGRTSPSHPWSDEPSA